LLEQLACLACGQAGQGGGHVKQVTLIQARHELAANVLQGPQAEHQQHGGHGQGELGAAQDGVEQGTVKDNQEAIERVALLSGDAPTDQVAHQYRYQRDGQTCGSRHGVGLREGQRREQPPLLCLQCEHRHEGQGDDQQREEQCGPYLRSRVANDFPTLGAFQGLIGMRMRPMLQMLVGVLDHHHVWAFSIITTAASTMAPMAMAMPPRDMMLAFTPW